MVITFPQPAVPEYALELTIRVDTPFGVPDLWGEPGGPKGETTDKIERFAIKAEPGSGGTALVPEGAAAWMECEVESSSEIKGYHLFIGRVVDQNDTGKPPLIWHKDGFFKLGAA